MPGLFAAFAGGPGDLGVVVLLRDLLEERDYLSEDGMCVAYKDLEALIFLEDMVHVSRLEIDICGALLVDLLEE